MAGPSRLLAFMSFLSLPRLLSRSSTPAMSPSATPQIPHPLTPLNAVEITACASVIRSTNPNTLLHFKAITLLEPPKVELIAFQDHDGPRPERRGYICYYLRHTDKLFEAVVRLSVSEDQDPVLESNVRVADGYHAAADGEEIVEVEKVVLQDEGVMKELEKLKLPEGTVVVSDPWIYGSDGIDDTRRQYQCFLYIQDPNSPNNPDSNHYAFPLSISAVVDVQTMRVTRIENLPTGTDGTPTLPKPYVVPPPAEYTPEHQPSLRDDLKPLQVVQPEGASFTVEEEGPGGAVISWQKWRFRVGFNYREGMVLYNVTYDGRSLFWRVSLSDMNIPYADPRSPYHKKSAFDLGDAGAGIMANNLQLGCDCLGSIHYLSALLSTPNGTPLPMPNVICIHEQDAGIGYKHTNYRTNRAVVTRARELVVQSIITVSNYEYILSYTFTLAADLIYEVRATGILSTAPIEQGLSVPWGTVVHPGVLAAHHQHIFSLRIDPALDGYDNRLVYEEAHAMPLHPVTNPHGTGYTTAETPITHTTGLDTNTDANRVFKITNPSSLNPTTRKPVAYKLVLPPFQKILAVPTSFHARRAEFADKALYLTRYREGELYAGGRWTNQSRGGEGVRSWASRKEDVGERGAVLWVQFGINHVPRTEDWPVMPCESLKVALRPVGFFERNPAGDVRGATQEFNKSVLLSGVGGVGVAEGAAEGHHQPGVEKVVGKGGGCCAK